MSTQTLPGRPAIRSTSTPRGADLAAFAAGAIAALVAMAIAELLAGLLSGAPSLIVAIADLIVDLQPAGAKQVVVDLFGDADKTVVTGGIVVAAAAIAGLLGVAGRRSFGVAASGFAIARLVGLIAAIRQPLTEPALAVLTTLLAIGGAIWALRVMLTACAPAWGRRSPRADTGPDAARAAAAMPDWERRRFLIRGSAFAVGSVAVAGLGRTLVNAVSVTPAPVAVLPDAAGAGVTVPAGADLGIEGLTPIVVPNDRFYRIDTAFAVPRVDVATWSVTVKGMVDTPVTLTYDQLTAMPQLEQFVTIACVSNDVGGRYVGNALWRGVDLRTVLAMAGVHSDATQIVGRSVDDFTVGFPTAWAMDPQRTPMIALQMNGEPLPHDHGYPARLIVPGLYGYVSATKWLKEMELTRLEDFDAYWVPLGWAKEAPILTQSRIDVPRGGSTVPAGATAVAGVAWAPDRGISAVEIKVDDGEWLPCTLSKPLAKAAWVQWTATWDATPGQHQIEVRATDGTGVVQTDERTSPAPDGARGHHAIGLQVA